MLTAIAIWFIYAILMTKDDFSTRFNVYDADASAPSRVFMPFRSTNGLNMSDVPLPGSAGRWRLPGDPSGIHQAAKMQQQGANLEFYYSLYGLLQGIVLIMFFIRTLFLVSFQPRLSVIPGGLVRMLPDFLHLYLVTFIIGFCLMMIWIIISGDRQEKVSTLYGAFITFLYAITSGVDNAYPYSKGLADNTFVSTIELVVIVAAHVLAAFIFIWFIKAMIITIIMWPFSILVHRARKATTVPQDLSKFIEWSYQKYKDPRNSNDSFLQIVDKLLSDERSGFKQALVKYVAARALKKAFSGAEKSKEGLSDARQVLNRIKLNQKKARFSSDGNRSSSLNIGDMSLRFSQQRSSNAIGTSRRMLTHNFTMRTSNTIASKLASEVSGPNMMDAALAPMQAPKAGMRRLNERQLDFVSIVKASDLLR